MGGTFQILYKSYFAQKANNGMAYVGRQSDIIFARLIKIKVQILYCLFSLTFTRCARNDGVNVKNNASIILLGDTLGTGIFIVLYTYAQHIITLGIV